MHADSGSRLELVRIPCPDDRRADLLGEELAQLCEVLDGRRFEADLADQALGRAEAATKVADRADPLALAESITAGEPDPGTLNVTAANAACSGDARCVAGSDGAGAKARLAVTLVRAGHGASAHGPLRWLKAGRRQLSTESREGWPALPAWSVKSPARRRNRSRFVCRCCRS